MINRLNAKTCKCLQVISQKRYNIGQQYIAQISNYTVLLRSTSDILSKAYYTVRRLVSKTRSEKKFVNTIYIIKHNTSTVNHFSIAKYCTFTITSRK